MHRSNLALISKSVSRTFISAETGITVTEKEPKQRIVLLMGNNITIIYYSYILI